MATKTINRRGQWEDPGFDATGRDYFNNNTADYESGAPQPWRNMPAPARTPTAPPVTPPAGTGGNTGGSTGGGGGGSTTAPKKPTLYSGEELAKLFGLVFGQEQIYDILQQATNAKFDEFDSQTRKNRDQQLTDYSTQYDQYLQNTRNQRQSALKNGLSKGTAVASEVLSQIGAQQQGAQTQQLYQQQLGDITYQRGSQLASDQYNAMMTQNDLATTLGNLSVGQYGNEVQHDAAYMSLLGQQAQAAAQNAMANAQRYSADQSRASYNDQSAAQQAQSSALYSSLRVTGMPMELAQAVAYGVLDYNSAMAAWNEQKRKNTPPTNTNANNTNYTKYSSGPLKGSPV